VAPARAAEMAAAIARRGALALGLARRGLCSASAPAAALSSAELIRMEQDCSAHKYGDRLPSILSRTLSRAVCSCKCLSGKSRLPDGAIPRIARVVGFGALDSVLVRRDESPGSSPRDPFRLTTFYSSSELAHLEMVPWLTAHQIELPVIFSEILEHVWAVI
jgi:hypothetical protein